MNTATDLAASAFPDREVRSVERIRTGNSKHTVVVEFGARDAVVMQYSETTSLDTEGHLQRAVGERTAVPVPTVLAMGNCDGASFIVTELADGDNLHSRFSALDRPVQRRLARQFGRFLAEIHDAFGFDAYGAVTRVAGGGESTHTADGDGHGFRATGAGDTREWLVPYAMSGIRDLPAAFDEVAPDLERVVETADANLPGEPVLYPWDFRPGNALARGRDLSAVLDWGDPLAGPTGLSVAKASYLVGDWYLADATPIERAFRDGYGGVRSYPAVPPLYRLVAVLRSAVDSQGVVTRPRYPEWTGDDAVEFHLTRLRDLIEACDRD